MRIKAFGVKSAEAVDVVWASADELPQPKKVPTTSPPPENPLILMKLRRSIGGVEAFMANKWDGPVGIFRTN